jgi:alkylated DNA repair dioxygenase AlkB
MTTADLFGHDHKAELPLGLRYEPQLMTADEAIAYVQPIARLPFEAFQFHGFTGKRRVVSFGWKYDFSTETLQRIEPVPDFLLPLRRRAASFAGIEPEALEQVLVTEYQPGAAIGWHRDKAVFDKVVGTSFGAFCTMRFRRVHGQSWQRRNMLLEPGSAYIIAGEARTDWEHSIPPVDALRYSVTFRSLRKP